MRLVNTNPIGAVDVPSVGRLEAGAEFEVPDELGTELLKQTGNYAPAKKSKSTDDSKIEG